MFIFMAIWTALFILGLWLMHHYIFAPWARDIDAWAAKQRRERREREKRKESGS